VKPVNLDSDFSEDVYLPSPNQLKYKILIKNKKLQPSQSSKQRVFQLIFLVVCCHYLNQRLVYVNCSTKNPDQSSNTEVYKTRIGLKVGFKRAAESRCRLEIA